MSQFFVVYLRLECHWAPRFYLLTLGRGTPHPTRKQVWEALTSTRTGWSLRIFLRAVHAQDGKLRVPSTSRGADPAPPRQPFLLERRTQTTPRGSLRGTFPRGSANASGAESIFRKHLSRPALLSNPLPLCTDATQALLGANVLQDGALGRSSSALPGKCLLLRPEIPPRPALLKTGCPHSSSF